MFHALLITAALAADPADIADYLAQAEEQRQEQIVVVARILAGARRSAKYGDPRYRQRNAAGARLRARELKALKANDPPFVPKLKFEVGSIGHIDTSFEISQIVDAENMLVRRGGFAAWVKGIRTTGLVDGESFKFAKCMKVTSTRQYGDTGGGTETVFQLEPFDEAAVFADRKQREQEAADAKAAKLAKARDKAMWMKAAKKQGRKS